MKKVNQKILHDPKKGINGDCWRASTASVLELPIEEVPAFEDLSNREAWHEYVKVLGKNGYGLYSVYVEAGEKHPVMLEDECEYYFMIGPSPRFPSENHQCVGCKGKLVHDPHPDKTGLKSLRSIEILVKL